MDFALVVIGIAVIGVAITAVLQWRRARVLAAAVEAARQVVGGDADDLEARVREAVWGRADAEARVGLIEAVLEDSSVGTLVVDASGRAVYANRVGRELTEGAGDQAVLRSRVVAMAQRVATDGVPHVLEVERADGAFHVVRAAPLADTPVGPPSVVVYLEDRSEERRIDAMRSDFVTNAAHELKTPVGAVSLLAEAISDSADEEQRLRLAERLRKEAARMANTIDDVIRLAEAQSQEVSRDVLQVASLVSDAFDSLASVAHDRGVEYVLGEIAEADVLGDREQLTSAVRNLLDNAITYTAIAGPGGCVTMQSHVADGMVLIVVEDTGIGISERYRDRVFERFFRVDRARSRESGGTGLGLSIVKNVAIAHGGTVELESKVGVGSTFTLAIPVAQEGNL